jgi:hypothetical protein
MAALTLATWYEALRDLKLTGVQNLLVPPTPAGMSAMHPPYKWVDAIGIEEEPLRRGALGGTRTLRARVVVVTDLIGQDLQPVRWEAALAMVDTLNAGIKSLGSTIGYTARWNVIIEPMLYDMAVAVVADITNPEYRA